MGQTHSLVESGVAGVHDSSAGGAPAAKLHAGRVSRRKHHQHDVAAPATPVLAPTAHAALFESLVDSPTTPELDNILTLVMGIFAVRTAVMALFDERRVRACWHA
jgi:hypothetical protein